MENQTNYSPKLACYPQNISLLVGSASTHKIIIAAIGWVHAHPQNIVAVDWVEAHLQNIAAIDCSSPTHKI